jgi:hypothetical protein
MQTRAAELPGADSIASKEENYYTAGESLDPMDWEMYYIFSADTILNCVVKLEHEIGSIILLYDAW